MSLLKRAAAAAFLMFAATAAEAAPSFSNATAVSAQPAPVTAVQWRGRGGWGGHRGWGGPGYFWGGVGAGVVAGAIIADSYYVPHRGYYYDTYDYGGPYYYPSDYHGDPRRICARYFKSFEWDTGYYTTYSGRHVLCPYLDRH